MKEISRLAGLLGLGPEQLAYFDFIAVVGHIGGIISYLISSRPFDHKSLTNLIRLQAGALGCGHLGLNSGDGSVASVYNQGVLSLASRGVPAKDDTRLPLTPEPQRTGSI